MIKKYNEKERQDLALELFFKRIKTYKSLKGESKEKRIGDFYYIYGNRELIIYDDKNTDEDEQLYVGYIDTYGDKDILVAA